MPILLLNEEEVRQLLTMDMALQAVEQGLRKLALDEAQNNPRVRSQTDHAMLHVMSAAAKTVGVMGYKAYSTTREGAQFHVGLFDGKTGDLTALVQADYLGQMRTGAASGIATRILARPDATRVGLFGAGKQARTQLLAVCHVRNISAVRVYSPTPEKLRAFCTEMSHACRVPVEPAASPEEATQNQDIVITATASREPVLKGVWLSQGVHLNIVGSNFLSKSEIDIDTLRRAGVILVDSKEQARVEAGDFHKALEAGVLQWASVGELGRVLTGRHPGRTGPHEITLFKSVGIAIEDVTTAASVVAKAREAGVGRTIEW